MNLLLIPTIASRLVLRGLFDGELEVLWAYGLLNADPSRSHARQYLPGLPRAVRGTGGQSEETLIAAVPSLTADRLVSTSRRIVVVLGVVVARYVSTLPTTVVHGAAGSLSTRPPVIVEVADVISRPSGGGLGVSLSGRSRRPRPQLRTPSQTGPQVRVSVDVYEDSRIFQASREESPVVPT